MTELAKKRPQFRNINIFTDVRTYRLPLAAYVSILHRASGILMFVLLPFVLWMFDLSLTSEYSFARLTHAFSAGAGVAPGWLLKWIALALIWAYLHHLLAGLRHVWMDVSHAAVTKEFGKTSAIAVLALSIGLTLVLGARLFGIY